MNLYLFERRSCDYVLLNSWGRYTCLSAISKYGPNIDKFLDYISRYMTSRYGGIPAKNLDGSLRGSKYLGLLTEELLLDILFYEELKK